MAKQIEETNGKAIQPRAYDKFRAYVQDRIQDDKIDPAQFAASVGDRILAAETEDQVWAANEGGGSTRLDSLAGCELEFQPNFRFAPSNDPEMSNSLGAFIIGEAIVVASANRDYNPGQMITYNTGVERVITTLRWFESQEKLPTVALVHGTDLGGGKTAISLRRPAARALPSTTQ